MDLKSNSLVVKLYNAIHFVGHQFWGTERRRDAREAHYYDSEEEYLLSIERSNTYLTDKSSTDICTVGRKLFVLGPLYTLIYIGFYIGMFFLLIGWNVSSFGLAYTLLGMGYVIGIALLICSGFLLIVYLSIKGSDANIMQKSVEAIKESVKSNSIVKVSKTWYQSFKDKTCVIMRVKD